VLGTVAWTVVANTARKAGEAAGKAAQAAHLKPSAAQVAAAHKAITDHSLAVGFSRGFEVSAGIMLIAVIVTIVMVRVTRQDLAGVRPPGMG
jgi:hypothetical protein